MKTISKQFRLCLTASLMVASCKRAELPTAQTLVTVDTFRPLTSMFQGTFTHPGILHRQSDIDRIKSKYLTTEPWKTAYTKFAADYYSQSTYPIQITDTVSWVVRGSGGVDIANMSSLRRDCNGAYQNALMYVITNNTAYATKAKTIVNKWAAQLQHIGGWDAQLVASLYGFKLASAAELLRYSPVGMTATEITNAENLFTNVFYPVIQNYNPNANGNWDAGMIKASMAYGIFCNNTTIFNKAVKQFYNQNTPTNGSLDKYILSTTGQCQESGRDQVHVQLGLGHLAEACQIGLSQGMDMFGSLSNRLLLGYEYTAKYNRGYTVPYQPYFLVDGTQSYGNTISSVNRDSISSIYEIVYNYYANRAHVSPSLYQNVKAVADSLRPERAPYQADHVGFGTLLFTIVSSSANLLTNGNFDTDASSWTASGSSTLTPYVDNGEHVIKVESRAYDWAGPGQDIKTTLLTNGPGTYDVSAAIKKITATTSLFTGRITISLTYGGTTHYFYVTENYANPWTTISGSVNLTWVTPLDAASFYIETPGNAWATEVDKCSLVKVN